MTQASIDPTPSRSSVKTAPRFGRSSPGGAIGWSDVLRALDADEAVRADVLALYRQGFRGCRSQWHPDPDAPRVWTPDDFATRRGARECMADALTAAEDRLDLERRSPRREALALALRDVRRRLEWELWP